METKIGFFKRIKRAIFNFEEYSNFINEKLTKAFGYLLKLITIITIIITLCLTYRTYEITNKIVEIFREEVPNFSIKEGILETENNEIFEYIDEENNFGIIVDSNKENIDNIENLEYGDFIVFLKDKIHVTTVDNNVATLNYANIIGQNFAKSDIEEILTNENLTKMYVIIMVITFITNFIVYICVFLIDILIISIIGFLINLITRVNLNYLKIFIISIYAKTLPIIFLTIYSIVTVYTNFTVKYFDLAYDAISYIYIITVLLIMKSDLIKNKQEIEKTIKKEKRENIEIEEKEKNKEENKKEEKKNKEKNKKEKQKKEENPGEPEGSNA